MKLSLFNTLTKKKEIFTPIDDQCVKMYVCGPTVYDHPHIGNARSVVTYDMLYRVLISRYGKDKVIYVRNITDIDDKIIQRAKKDKVSIKELTVKTTEYFHSDMDYLNCLRPNFEPRATEHLEDMCYIINVLLDKDIAYRSEGHIYFDISKVPEYTELSGQSIDKLFESVRIETSFGKKNPGDFVLWKPASSDDSKDSIYPSPFGLGRPGWHIECSAMSYRFLGKTFDIHGGGVDLIFPHHTNEIAQSCSAFDDSEYAKYWVHNGFLTVNREKMSKSLGNFTTVKDLIDQGIAGDTARLFLLSNHYRKPLDYNSKAIADAEHMLDYWYRAIELFDDFEITENINLPPNFYNALLDDINTPEAVKVTNEFAKIVYNTKEMEVKLDNLKKLVVCARFLGLLNKSVKEWFGVDLDSVVIEELINQRKAAKIKKDWLKADAIRQDLVDHGVTIEDHSDGTTTWKKLKKMLEK